jgi:redox-sensitive bicupin YhaK (pirin superfamily)
MMNATSVPTITSAAARRIVHRSAGHSNGGITRLMSPGDLGQLVKPFVFLDYFDVPSSGGPGIPMHPHSGIATHTTLLSGSVNYQDSTGKSGRLLPGSIEWMRAGGGVWHTGSPVPGEKMRGFQLWIALPPALEHAPAESHYVDASMIPGDGRVRVLLGEFGSMRSAIVYEPSVAYLHVRLRDGEAWSYQPPPEHDVAWLAVAEGTLRVGDTPLQREMAVFEESNARVEGIAQGETELVVGSAVKHPHPLVCGNYSVHTSREALRRGEAGIESIRKRVE